MEEEYVLMSSGIALVNGGKNGNNWPVNTFQPLTKKALDICMSMPGYADNSEYFHCFMNLLIYKFMLCKFFVLLFSFSWCN